MMAFMNCNWTFSYFSSFKYIQSHCFDFREIFYSFFQYERLVKSLLSHQTIDILFRISFEWTGGENIKMRFENIFLSQSLFRLRYYLSDFNLKYLPPVSSSMILEATNGIWKFWSKVLFFLFLICWLICQILCFVFDYDWERHSCSITWCLQFSASNSRKTEIDKIYHWSVCHKNTLARSNFVYKNAVLSQTKSIQFISIKSHDEIPFKNEIHNFLFICTDCIRHGRSNNRIKWRIFNGINKCTRCWYNSSSSFRKRHRIRWRTFTFLETSIWIDEFNS